MSKLKKLFTNSGSTAAYAAISGVFTLVPEDFFKLGVFNCDWSESAVVLMNRMIVCIFIFCIANIIYFFWRKQRTKVFITDKNSSIEVYYGDLIKVRDGKKIIHFDECYTTIVGSKPGDIKPNSVCGQYLAQHPIDDIHALIDNAGVKPKGHSLFENRDRYEPGIIIPKDDYLLMAFAKLDKEGRGFHTYDSYLKCLDKLWEQIDLYHGTNDVYIPILGSRVTRFDKDLTQQELLDIMIASYRLHPQKLRKPNILHIVCKEREGFSLNDILGVE